MRAGIPGAVDRVLVFLHPVGDHGEAEVGHHTHRVQLVQVLPHDVQRGGADERVLDGAGEQERRRRVHQLAHDVRAHALGERGALHRGAEVLQVFVQLSHLSARLQALRRR